MYQKRIFAWGIDFIVTSFIQMILMVLFLVRPIIESGDDNYLFNIWIRQLSITYCSVSYLIIRDIICKKSIGKKIFNLKIINKKDEKQSNVFKRFIRNITWLLGPIELLIYLITNERLGDKIAGTKIVDDNYNEM